MNLSTPGLFLLVTLAVATQAQELQRLPEPITSRPMDAIVDYEDGFAYVVNSDGPGDTARVYQVELAPLMRGDDPLPPPLHIDLSSVCVDSPAGPSFLLRRDPHDMAAIFACGTNAGRLVLGNGTFALGDTIDWNGNAQPASPLDALVVDPDPAFRYAYMGSAYFESYLYRVSLDTMQVTNFLDLPEALFNIQTAFVDEQYVYYVAQKDTTAVIRLEKDSAWDLYTITEFSQEADVGLPAFAVYDAVNSLAYIYGSDGIIRYEQNAPLSDTRVILEGDATPTRHGHAVDSLAGDLILAVNIPADASGTILKTLYLAVDMSDPDVPISSVPHGDPFPIDRGGETIVQLDDRADHRQSYFFFYEEGAPRFGHIPLPDPCPNDCSNTDDEIRGTCDFGVCDCLPFASGPDCGSIQCPECFNGFECDGSTGLCDCGLDSGFRGANCTLFRCPFDCSSHGTCSNDEARICTCDEGWEGDDCGQPAVGSPLYESCSDIPECSICTGEAGQNLGCGWCESSSICFDADAKSGCKDFYFDSCFQPFVPLISWLVSSIALLLLLVNAISAVLEDRTQNFTKNGLRTSWWRAQRSAKAWALVDRLQFVALLGLVGASVPSLYSNFARGFSLFLFAVPIISASSSHEYPDALAKLNGVQEFAARIGVTEEMVLPNVLLAIVILAAVSYLVLFVLYQSISTKMVKNAGTGSRRVDPRLVMKDRMVYMGIRLINLALPGIAVFSSYHITNMNSGGIYVVLALVGLLSTAGFGVFYPMLLFKHLHSRGRALFQKEFRRRYGCLYEPYHFKKSEFYVGVVIRKFIIAFSIGVFQSVPEASMSLVIVAQVLYLVFLIARRPYLDNFHWYLDVGGSLADLLSACIFLVFLGTDASFADRDKSDDATGAIAAFQLLLAFITIMTFVHSWLQLRSIFTFQQFVNCLTFRKEAPAGSVPLKALVRTSSRNTAASSAASSPRSSVGANDAHDPDVEVETVVMQRGNSTMDVVVPRKDD